MHMEKVQLVAKWRQWKLLQSSGNEMTNMRWINDFRSRETKIGRSHALSGSMLCEAMYGEVIRNNVCYLKQAEAGCIGIEVMWYFDSEKNVCMEYSKGMCGSTANSFYSCEECLQKCLTSACASRIPTLWERLFGRG
ncbi:protein AMBP-like isoform X1 [Dermacentor variabilis]|uniref:protein AMBP-like isoform X1 n=1 Tax=Dermacentor variabilis TaxID=34621 RepID=UPI003F5B750B